MFSLMFSQENVRDFLCGLAICAGSRYHKMQYIIEVNGKRAEKWERKRIQV